MSLSTVALLCFLGASLLPPTLAANDFTTPCRGSCSYESGDGINTAWNSILLDGAPEAISDISHAAGWNILSCNATSIEAQVIRLVCTKPENGCDDLFLGGAHDTIVRLPDDCAGAPFARVVSIQNATDQSVPVSVMAELSKRGTQPKVLSLSFDYDFGKLPASRGEVTFTTVATTNPLQRPFTQVSRMHAALRRSTGMPSFLRKRDLFDDFVSNNKITTDTPRVNIASVNGTATNSGSVVRKWDKGDTRTFNLLDVHKNFPIFDGSISCPAAGSGVGFSANAHLDADVDVSVNLTVGYILSGKIFPPGITRAAFTTALEGDAQAVFNVRADAIGSFDTGLLTLYEVGLPGLDIPGIITVGPSFAIKGQAQASLDVVTQAKITAAYKLPNLQFVFPKDQGDSSATADNATPAQPLTLSVGGSASLTGKVEAHVIPRVEFGVSLLFGAAQASIYLEVDGYGVLDMHLAGSNTTSTSTPILIGAAPSTTEASTSTSTSINASTNTSVSTSASTGTSISASGETTNTSTTASASTSNNTSISTSTSTCTYDATTSTDEGPTRASKSTRTSTSADAYAATTMPPVVVDTAKTQFGKNLYKPTPVSGANSKRDVSSFTYQGCVGLDVGVSVNGGAQGALFNLWSGDINWDIYSQKWDIFEKCFGAPSTRRRSEPKLHTARFDLRSNQLTCPSVLNQISLI